MKTFAYAKINAGLNVVRRREDGYKKEKSKEERNIN